MIISNMTFYENSFASRVRCKQADSILDEANNGNVTIYAIKSCMRRSDIAPLIPDFCGRWR